jgi:acylphosphatase
VNDGFEKASRRWVVSGRVQGVGYRVFAARAARSLGLSGGASNLDDGRVEVFAEGPQHALERLEALLHEGPRHGRVEELRCVEEPVSGESFDVDF